MHKALPYLVWQCFFDTKNQIRELNKYHENDFSSQQRYLHNQRINDYEYFLLPEGPTFLCVKENE